MGRRGADWRKIKSMNVLINNETITIELDNQERIKGDKEIFNKLKLTEYEKTQIISDYKKEQEKEPIIEPFEFNMNDCPLVEDSFFDDQTFMLDIPDDSYFIDSILLRSDENSFVDNLEY